MALTHRPIAMETDKDIVLQLHCLANYEGDPAWFRGESLEDYRSAWFATPQPAAFLASLAALIDDPKAVVEVWEEDGRLVGYVCVSFLELDGYPIVVAEVEDIAVLPAYQRQGIGTEMLTYAEAEARVRGAGVLRADIGVANAASKALHERQGFAVFRQSYEKRLES